MKFNALIDFFDYNLKKELIMRLLFFSLCTLIALHAEGVLEIDWSTVDVSSQQKAFSYPKDLIEGVKNVKLPVYLSAAYIYDKSMVVVSDKGFYSISFVLNGATLLFEGDRTYQESVSPQNLEFQKIVQKTTEVEVSQSEGIMMADFNQHGANYAISVECEKPKTDKRCTDENFIKTLYHDLKMVGGHP